MGYETSFTLEVRNVTSVQDFNKLVSRMREKDLIYYALDEGHYDERLATAYFDPWGQVKWYDHTELMSDIAREFPSFIFRLYGVGELNDDLWYEYYHDCDVEYCPAEITFPKPKQIEWSD